MSKKRADRRTGGLFPELSRPADQRFAAPRKQRPWTVDEESLLLAAITLCGNRSEYERMAPWLMKIANHEPSYGEDYLPSARVHVQNCVRALELRVVSNILKRESLNEIMLRFQSVPELADQTHLTWGCRAKIIRPWLKIIRGTRLPGEDISYITGGSQVVTEGMSEAIHQCKKKKTDDPDHNHSMPPLTALNWEIVAPIIKVLNDQPERDLRLWEVIWEVMRRR